MRQTCRAKRSSQRQSAGRKSPAQVPPPGVALRERKGKFVDIFRTTPTNTVCPNFFVLSHANGCLFQPQCSYCYLKSSFWYLTQQQAFTNLDEMEQEVADWIARDELESYVLNSGNLSDSLVFEDVRPMVTRLMEVFRREAEAKGRPHTLLLLTKGGAHECRPLTECPPCRNVVVSFSINSPEAARQHERGAAPAEERLATAKTLKSLGWRLRIRIDPMIEGFDYSWTIQQVAELRPERVTLGTLRAEANLPKFVAQDLFAALEAPANPKGLARYPKDRRLAIYRQAVDKLREVCSIGLCEETADIWLALGLDTEAKSCNCGS